MQIEGSGQTVTCPQEEVTVIYPEKYKVKRQTATPEEKEPDAKE